MLGERCGSPAISGVPVFERAPLTAQLFEPEASAASPSERRTRSICSTSGIPSPVNGCWSTTGLSAGIDGVEPGRQLRPELADQVGPQQLPLPVGREAEGEQLAEAEDVDRPPGLQVSRRICISKGSARASRAAALTPAQKRSSFARRPGSISSTSARRSRGSPASASACRPRGPPRRPSRRPGPDDPPVEVHLPEPVLAVAVALGEEEVLALGGVDVGDAPAVAPHAAPFRAAPGSRSSPHPGQRPPRQAVPETRRRMRAARRQPPARASLRRPLRFGQGTG